MTKTRQLLALVTLCAVPFTVPHSAAIASAPEPEWPAMDDGPCPAGMTSDVQPGWDYTNGVWTDANGGTVGYAPEEDECIRLVADDLAPATVVRHTDGVTLRTSAQPMSLPETL